MKLAFLSATILAALAPAGAQASVTFNGVCANGGTATQAACSSSSSGTYGNAATIQATNDATLKLKITAWQFDQSTSKISNAFLGAYAGGFGVTGAGDVYKNQAGGNGTHQIDNSGGYTDFVMLQFSRAVKLDGLDLNIYSPYNDSDVSIWNASAATPSGAWDSKIDLSGLKVSSSPWSNTSGDGNSGYRTLNTTGGDGTNGGFSQVWMVSASVLTNSDDGFKLELLNVTPKVPAVPEPATWGMMIVGFGAIGATMRRRRTSGVPQVA